MNAFRFCHQVAVHHSLLIIWVTPVNLCSPSLYWTRPRSIATPPLEQPMHSTGCWFSLTYQQDENLFRVLFYCLNRVHIIWHYLNQLPDWGIPLCTNLVIKATEYGYRVWVRVVVNVPVCWAQFHQLSAFHWHLVFQKTIMIFFVLIVKPNLFCAIFTSKPSFPFPSHHQMIIHLITALCHYRFLWLVNTNKHLSA